MARATRRVRFRAASVRGPAVLALVALATSAATAREPVRPRMAAGLPPATEAAEARGIVVLRPPRGGRARIGGATFAMGSTELELLRGFAMCRREPFGEQHDAQNEAYCDPRELQSELPRHAVTLSPYFLDRTEVTVGDYDRCVSAGACGAPGYPRGDARFDRANFPVTMVTWEAASAFCQWAGGRLPTEAEWEFAARGIEARAFPWGEVYNGHLCNHGSLAEDSTDGSDGFTGLAPVGSFPDGATPTGLLDLAGNVQEWVQDRNEARVLRSGGVITGYSAAPLTNPVSTSGVGHYARGGSYRTGSHTMRAAARAPLISTTQGDYIGFRCAYDH
jgi:hypothetical protein